MRGKDKTKRKCHTNSKETIMKISDKNKGKKRSKEFCINAGIIAKQTGNLNWLGKKHTEESKLKMRSAKLGKKQPKELVKKRIKMNWRDYK